MNYLTQALRSAPVLIILSMIFILIEFNIPPIFTHTFGRAFNAREPLTLSFMVIYSLIFLLLTPLLINQLFFKEPLSSYGLNLPADRKKTFFLVAAALLLLVPASIVLGQQKPMQFFYSLKNFSYATIAFDFILAFPPYYLAEEFFFRGFLFLRLQRKIGWHSYWITELIFTWAHLGKPPIEILFSFPAGLALNYLTLKTRSIFPAMWVNYILGVVMTFYVTFFV